jgi:hypothetical protein
MGMQQSALNLLKLYSVHDGVPGYPIENWYVRNTSTSQAIKFTVLFWKGNIDFGDSHTDIFEIEPGEIKGIGNKRGYGNETTHAKITGARFIN